MKSSYNLPFDWFDVVLVLLLFVGLARGRKRGLSQELFTMILWLAIVIICAVAYQPLGNALTSASPLSPLFCYLACYIGVAMLVAMAFAPIKRSMGGKVISADTFGSAEYYIGMPAGVVRFYCILIACLALINARLYTRQEIAANEKYQKDVYGSEFFPGLDSLQQDIFVNSFTGPYVKKYLDFLLIKPTPPQKKQLQRAKEPWVP
jgi:uncharacterized membrane protein required for colicin V production